MQLTDKIQITNEDNMLLMARYPDNYFDLAIVDPPYGMGDVSKFTPRKTNCAKNKIHKETKWNDETPKDEYWAELFRVSKNQIVWGANYMTEKLPISRGWIFWDKGYENTNNFSAGELAWTSFDTVLKKIKIVHRVLPYMQPNIHPTQKPVELYKWILDKYAKQGDKILDTHLGSGSIAIACHDYKFNLTACELDKEYFDKAMERIENHTAQTKLF
jgi:site-specific DNA-methyltransferase (adenine-specific)